MLEKIKIDALEIDWSFVSEQHRKRFFNKNELETIIFLLKKYNVKKMAEFGCQNGRTAKMIINNIKSIEKYYGVDVPPNSNLSCEVQKNEVPKQAGELALDEEKFTLLLHKNGSRGIEDCLPELDCIFIDGDHSFDGVIADHFLALKKIKKGIIIHHDYHDLGTVGVKDALHELSYNNKFYHVDGTWLCYQVIEA